MPEDDWPPNNRGEDRSIGTAMSAAFCDTDSVNVCERSAAAV
jgi:hypothetical protein